MKINLQVISSTKVETRKPWPRIKWMGQDRENLMLLRNNYIKKFNPETGKTKKITEKCFRECVALSCTKNGAYLIGLQVDGNIFRWCKDTESAVSISNDRVLHDHLELATFTKNEVGNRLLSVFGNDAGSRIAVISYYKSSVMIYLWESKACYEHQDLPQQVTDRGSWLLVGSETEGSWMMIGSETEGSLLRPPSRSSSLTWDTCFSPETTRCESSESCISTFVYTDADAVQIITCKVTFDRLHRVVGVCPTYRWKATTVPFRKINQDVDGSVDIRKMYVVRWSNSGEMLVIAVNLKRHSKRDFVIFTSQNLQRTVIVSLPEEFSSRRHHRWVCDIAWTANDTFVVLINKLGSVCLMSRFGEPLTISTRGCSMDLPSTKFLNIHPYIFVERPALPREENENSSVSLSSADILRQKFSVSAHPRLPYFLCSDGYLVTCLCLPDSAANVYSFAEIYLKYLRKLRKNMSGSTVVCEIEPEPEDQFENYAHLAKSRCGGLNTSLTDFSSGDSEDELSRLDQLILRSSLIGDFDGGVISIGSHSRTKPDKHVDGDNLCSVTRCLMSVWGLMATEFSEWTSEWEKLSLKASHQLVKICSILLSKVYDLTRFREVLHFVKDWFYLCCGDISQTNLWVTVLRTFKRIYVAVLKHRVLETAEKFLWECFQLLIFAENIFKNTHLNMADETTSRRLSPLWKKLQRRIQKLGVKDETLKLLVLNRTCLIKKRNYLFKIRGTNKLLCGSRLLLIAPNEWKSVVDSWKVEVEQQLQGEFSLSSAKVVSNLLHAGLYALLAKYKPKESLLYVFWMFSKLIGDQSNAYRLVISRTIRSFAYFLSDFVAGNRLAVYPFHRPHCLSRKLTSNLRVVPLQRQKFVSELRRDVATSKHWTHDEALALLLYLEDFKGAFCLTERLGDGKLATLVKYAESIATQNVLCTREVGNILFNQIIAKLNDSERISKKDFSFYKDYLIAGSLCHVSVLYPVLHQMFSDVVDKIFVDNFSLLIPDFIYLPRPPFYCPQLVDSEEDSSPDVPEENWAKDVSSSVRKLIDMFRISNCLVSSAFTYLRFLRKTVGEVMKVKDVKNYLWPLEMTFQRLNDVVTGVEDDVVDGLFRDFCSICFFLHAKDKLNTSLRRIRVDHDDLNYKNRLKSKDKSCLDSLAWIILLSSFDNIGRWDKDLTQILISTISEAPIDRRTSRLLARMFPDPSTIPRAVGLRLKPVFQRWSSSVIRVASNRKYPERNASKTLSAIYLEQCHEVNESINKLQESVGEMEEKVRLNESAAWKTRFFEIEEDFFQFLKIFLDIILVRDLAQINEDAEPMLSIPITVSNRKELYEKCCIFDVPSSTVEPKSVTFEQRLISDIDELTRLGSSSQRKCTQDAKNANSTNQNRRLLNYKMNRSCLQYLSEMSELDNDKKFAENEETRRTLLWLLQWSKVGTSVTSGEQPTLEANFKFHVSFKQIWSAMQNKNEISSVKSLSEFIESDDVQLQNRVSTGEMELQSASEPTSDEEEFRVSTEKFSMNSDDDSTSFQSLPNKSNDSLSLDLETLNLESDDMMTSRCEYSTDTLGLDLESLNRETDGNTAVSSSPEWTLDVGLIEDPPRKLRFPKIYECSSKLSSDEDTVDNVSTSDELGDDDQADVHVTGVPTVEIPEEPGLFFPPLLKLEKMSHDSCELDPAKDYKISEVPFLTLEDLHRLTSKWINSSSEVPEFEKVRNNLFILNLPEEDPKTTEPDEPLHTNNLGRKVSLSRGVQTRSKIVKNASMLTNINYLDAKRTKEKNRKQKLTVDEAVDVQSRYEVIQTAPKMSSSTQTNVDQALPLEFDGTKQLPTNVLEHSEQKLVVVKETELEITFDEPRTRLDVDLQEKSDDKQLETELFEVPVTDKDSNLNISQFKERLKQLEDDGVLETEMTLQSSLRSTTNVHNIRTSSTVADVEFQHRNDNASRHVRDKDAAEVKIDDPAEGFLTTISSAHTNRALKQREINRLKLQSKHFKQRKADALKFLGEIFEDRQSQPQLYSLYEKPTSRLKVVEDSGVKKSAVRFQLNPGDNSQSSTDDTISPWIVPEEVQKLLYGDKNLKLKQTPNAFIDISDSVLCETSDDDDSLFSDAE